MALTFSCLEVQCLPHLTQGLPQDWRSFLRIFGRNGTSVVMTMEPLYGFCLTGLLAIYNMSSIQKHPQWTVSAPPAYGAPVATNSDFSSFPAIRQFISFLNTNIMDWLPLPRHPVRPPLELTCLTTRNYDHGDFESYPTRVGFHDRPWREWNKTFEEQADELAKLFETWLLWGCLESLIGAHIQVSDYVHVENGAHVVRLGSLMESLSIDTNIDSNQTEVMRVLKFMETLAQAFKVHDMLLPANVIFEGLGRSKLRIPTDNNLAIPLAQYLEDTEGVTDLRSKELVLWLVAFTEVMMNKITIIVQKGMQRYEHITDQSGLRALRDRFHRGKMVSIRHPFHVRKAELRMLLSHEPCEQTTPSTFSPLGAHCRSAVQWRLEEH